MADFQPYDEQLFEGRNQAYGAYQMRKQYWRNYYTAWAVTGSLLLSLILFLVAAPYIWPAAAPQQQWVMTEVVIDTTGTDTTIYNMVDKMPEFPGGEVAMFKYLAENLRKPADQEERASHFVVEFVVEKDGSLTQVTILRPQKISETFRGEVLRLVRSMPRWSPGMLYGQPVRVRWRWGPSCIRWQ